MSEQSYPLAWPEGWPRTPYHKQERGEKFKKRDWASGRTGLATFASARDRLNDELRRLGARHVVVSTNHKPDRNGVPVEAKRKPDDDGIAVYFLYDGKQMAMACDRYHTAAANMTSLALAIEAMRQLERHGGGTMMERAFAGFAALPPARASGWRAVLGFTKDERVSEQDVRRAWARLAAEHHPDVGGDHQRMAEVNAARDEALKEFGQ